MNIVVDQNIAAAKEYLSSLGAVNLVDGRSLCAADLKHAQALLVRSVTRVDRALLEGSNIQFVGTATSGVDHVDTAYLQANDIGFAHAPGSNANSVVEYVLSAIATSDSKLEELFAGGVVGVIGFGTIGRLLVTRLRALDIKFKIYDPWLDASSMPVTSSLEEVLRCDVVSLHVALTHKQPWPSYHLLGEQQLRQINPQALLINASRGAVIDNRALECQLKSGAGPSCVIDVWEGEPQVSAELLSQVKFGTAHIAGYSWDGKLLATRMLRTAVARHFDLCESGNDIERDDPSTVLQLSGEACRTPANCLRRLLREVYDLSLDDQLLRDSMIPSTKAGASFDALRKRYRKRPELHGSVVVADQLNSSLVTMLAALGCQVELHSQVKSV